MELPYDLTIPLLGVCPEKNHHSKRYRRPVFIAALLTIAKTWRQPKCPSAEGWVKKTCYIYATECCSAVKMNETTPLAATRMDLEIIKLREVSRTETNVIGDHSSF